MLKINRTQQELSTLASPSLADVSITERYDLQEYIANSPDEFFNEIGQELFLIGTEKEPSSTVADRIDLLAIDKEGTVVVIELKRGSNKLQMFQAISYAGMISQWSPDDVFQLLDSDRQESLAEFLNVESQDINRRQRIVLVAEGYDYALLAGAEWLAASHQVDIVCCRIAIAKDGSTDSEYLTCSIVYPAPELAEEAVNRGRRRSSNSSRRMWIDWDEALADIENKNIVAYFERELAANRETYLPRRCLMYRVAGKRRWKLHAHSKNAYVWQIGRFSNDVDFWSKRMTQPNEVEPKKRGTCLRMFLTTEEDFHAFHNVATRESAELEWNDGDGGEPEGE